MLLKVALTVLTLVIAWVLDNLFYVVSSVVYEEIDKSEEVFHCSFDVMVV